MQQQHALCTVEGIKATAFLEKPILEGRNTKVFLLLLGRSIAAVHPSYTSTIKSTTSKKLFFAFVNVNSVLCNVLL